ncbi:baseplate J/gp47 family protein [Crassaminicella profunda]|uniref:baseplate J/gp47 family protein n=1 Tax=Crassaminicella profunda TaxID=1286698 RepID=UPI001CA6255F|nr:baseplate J/gp47 family protein [Crassaminicella profunda]QZY54470.1 baseplate J/gp47 family protein [Crassaminicella profunda]
MLPLPNLDDQEFIDILEESKKLIPRYAPQWTDENVHDPGITFLELFAWLKEMQQYYMDQISQKSKYKFLKLLGVKPFCASPSKINVEVEFKSMKPCILLPQKLKFLAEDIHFEIEKEVKLYNNIIEKIIVVNEGIFKDVTNINIDREIAYYAFGKNPKVGNEIYIGMHNPLWLKDKVSIFFHIYDEYNIKRNKIPRDFEKLAQINWKIYGNQEGKEDWYSLEILEDDTHSFLQSGNITFKEVPHIEQERRCLFEKEELYWIKGELHQSFYDVSPKIEKVSFNVFEAIQKNTYCEYIDVPMQNLEQGMVKIDSYLGIYGDTQVQMKVKDHEWIFVDEFVKKDIDEKNNVCIIEIDKKIINKMNLLDQSWWRMIHYDKEFKQKRIIGESNGLPNQIIELPDKEIVYDDFQLQVGRINEEHQYIWEDWEKVEDLETSKPRDSHYMLDEDLGIIQFGDNEHGKIPYIGQQNIAVIAYGISNGEQGNIKTKDLMIVSNEEYIEEIKANNCGLIQIGKDKETIEEAKLRMEKELNGSYRAITEVDYENIVLSTPGLRIARVKVLSLYRPGLLGYPNKKAENCITLVVVPYSDEERPILNKMQKLNIQKYINEYRLITTEVHVMSPKYIGITVYGEVVVKPYYRNGIESIKKELKKFLNPIDSIHQKNQWQFGDTVHRGKLYDLVNGLGCIEYVKRLSISASGTEFHKNSNGDIEIPYYGLAYFKECYIEMVVDE